jgi:hypothetical protein
LRTAVRHLVAVGELVPVVVQFGQFVTVTFLVGSPVVRARYGIGDTPYVIDVSNQDNYPLMSPVPRVPWDITGSIKWISDNKCDIRDIAQVAVLFGSVAGDGRYDRRADITGPTYLIPDGKIDIRDVALIAKHFEKTCP